MVIGNAAPILREGARQTPGLLNLIPAFLIITSIANASGRFIWGLLLDRIGVANSMLVNFVMTGVSSLALSGAFSTYLVFPPSIHNLCELRRSFSDISFSDCHLLRKEICRKDLWSGIYCVGSFRTDRAIYRGFNKRRYERLYNRFLSGLAFGDAGDNPSPTLSRIF